MFVDEVTVTVAGGKGGDGMTSFRREKFVPFGGPDGGDGGQGGSVVLVAEHNCDTLSNFRMQKVFHAPDGGKGTPKNMHGKNAPDMILHVPVGTIVYDVESKEVIADLDVKGRMFVVAAGGRGGFGNAHFTSSTRQAPSFSELGDRGEKRKIMLSVKLVADVGLIGLPNAGKSTLISRVSSARPKIANYPFTTLIPNLGIATHQKQNFVISDNPGLIAGAAGGKGLGIEFLKHIERTRILVHVVDASSGSPYKEYAVIQKELSKYDTQTKKKKISANGLLADKQQLVVLNKCELLDEPTLKKLQSVFQKKGVPVICISAVTGLNMKQLLDAIVLKLQVKDSPEIAISKEPLKIFRPHLTDDKSFEIHRKGKEYVVTGKRLEQIVRMSRLANPEAMERIYDVLAKSGVAQALLRQGAKDGDRIRIGEALLFFRG